MINTATEVPAGCRLECENSEPFLDIPENQGAAITRLVRCRDCGLVIERPRPSRTEIDAFYNNPKLWTATTDAEGHRRSYIDEIPAKKKLFADLARRIERRVSGGRLLDVGSGAGILELTLTPERWEVVGVDSSRGIVDVGRLELGTNVLHTAFENFEAHPASFDVIVMKYVLDHLEEPWEALRRARALVKPGGWLVIADLINIDSFCARLFREGHRLIHPMHFTYFSPRTIKLHLARAGFEVVSIDRPFVRTPYFTAGNLRLFTARVLRRALNQYVWHRPGKVFSTAFYGNLIDVWARPTNGS